GMTVLQAVALSGGEFRAEGTTFGDDQIRLQGDLQGVENSLMRSVVRIARLKAELDGSETITLPTSLPADGASVQTIFQQELAIFSSRRNEQQRQLASLNELKGIYSAEIDVLNEKIAIVEDQLAKAETQLSNVTELVQSGNATLSRQTDLERMLG